MALGDRQISMEHSIEVFSGKTLVFHSSGKWLYPLFDLERFLATADYDPTNLIVKDKIIGRAAALLLIHLGIGCVVAVIMSKPGKDALEKYGIKYKYDSLIDRIACRTEELLIGEDDPKTAYKMLKQRAGL